MTPRLSRFALIGTLGALAACGGGGGATRPEATTKVTSCRLEAGEPVVRVRVDNDSKEAGRFHVVVQFIDGDTVLGEAKAYTTSLQPGQGTTVAMGNMGRKASALDTCTVTSAERMSD